MIAVLTLITEYAVLKYVVQGVNPATKNLGIDIEVEYITDLQKVMTYGVMSMPAIVVNDKVVSMGKVLKTADVEKLLDKLQK